MSQVPGKANIINHIGLALDASSSMLKHARNLVQVADNQIEYLALRSKELDQETRISVWTFADAPKIECVVWDKDVLRLPSIKPFYNPYGNTAFIDATLKAIEDLAETPERYGDHSFLLYVLTDGAENDSRNRPDTLSRKLAQLPDHWTVAAMVPDAKGKHEAKQFGFPAGNVEIWDTTSNAGISEVGKVMRAATDAYMDARRTGVRSTRSLFSTGADAVNAKTIQAADLKPLDRNTYVLIPVPKDAKSFRIDEFTQACGFTYRTGKGYYELMKTETIQAGKEIAIVERSGQGRVFMGRDARNIIGLPDMEVRVKPDYNREYAVFVQSTSINRKLVANTRYLYML